MDEEREAGDRGTRTPSGRVARTWDEKEGC